MKLEEYEKVLYIVDMNNGFVNFGPMANPKYNDLVEEQIKLINKIKKEKGLVNFILEGHDENALEFKTYPKHCVLGSDEAKLIEQLQIYQDKKTKTYYKNSINGMLNRKLQNDIKKLKKLKEIVVAGVCTDLCVMDFVRTYLRYLDEINKESKLFIVKNTVDTFDTVDHNKEEWTNIAYKVMMQAGAIVVNNIEELEIKEKELKLKH